jgi:hypothetical protein
VNKLLDDRELARIAPHQAAAGDSVLYFAEGRLKHAAVLALENGRLTSKWGPGEMFEHGLLEVPLSYGEPIVYCQRPDPTAIVPALRAFLS